jgi:hypothetical protein
MLSDMILKDTALITGTTAAILKTQVKNTVSLEALKPMIETFTYNLPAKEVKEGDSWTLGSPINSGGMDLEIRSDYLLKSINNNSAEISAESSIKASENAKPLNYNGANITYDNLSGMGKSQLTIDPQTGFMKKSSTKMQITGDLSISVQGMNMQIPMLIDSQSDVTEL